MDKLKGLLGLALVLGACAGGDDSSVEGSDGGTRGIVWECGCVVVMPSFSGDTTTETLESETCGETDESPKPGCDCTPTIEPCIMPADEERGGIMYRGPYRADDPAEGAIGELVDASVPAVEDAAVEPPAEAEPEATGPPTEDAGAPVPIYTQTCTGSHDDIGLEYRATIYDTHLTLTECWERLNNVSTFRKYVLEPGDEGADTRACALTGERPWAFETFTARGGGIVAYASHLTLRIPLDCAEVGLGH